MPRPWQDAFFPWAEVSHGEACSLAGDGELIIVYDVSAERAVRLVFCDPGRQAQLVGCLQRDPCSPASSMVIRGGVDIWGEIKGIQLRSDEKRERTTSEVLEPGGGGSGTRLEPGKVGMIRNPDGTGGGVASVMISYGPAGRDEL